MVSGYGGFTAVVQTLLIDNFDSFTYNLAELVTAVNGMPPIVVTNDVSWEELDFAAIDNVVVSPGPGSPTVREDFGICGRVMAESGLPVLGVCLGHQGLCAAFGARVVRAPDPVHGRLSTIRHVGRDLFAGIPSPMSVVRYHSLIVGRCARRTRGAGAHRRRAGDGRPSFASGLCGGCSFIPSRSRASTARRSWRISVI